MNYNVRIEEELLPFYALGALTDEEIVEVEAYLEANPEARLRLDDLALGVEAIAMSVAQVAPDPGTKAQLMNRVTTSPQSLPAFAAVQPSPAAPAKARQSWFSRFKSSPANAEQPRSMWPTMAWAFSLLLVLGLGWATLSLRNQVGVQQDEVAALRSSVDALTTNNQALTDQLTDQQAQLATTLEELAILNSENVLLRDELNAQQDQLALFREPGTMTLSIGSISDAVPDATATLSVSPESDMVVMRANSLPELDDDRNYQLWLIADGVAISAGVFDTGPDGQAILEVLGGLPANLQAVGISVEPAGGSEQPTPDQIILFGEVTT